MVTHDEALEQQRRRFIRYFWVFEWLWRASDGCSDQDNATRGCPLISYSGYGFALRRIPRNTQPPFGFDLTQQGVGVWLVTYLLCKRQPATDQRRLELGALTGLAVR
jgi:hypothetical protein